MIMMNNISKIFLDAFDLGENATVRSYKKVDESQQLEVALVETGLKVSKIPGKHYITVGIVRGPIVIPTIIQEEIVVTVLHTKEIPEGTTLAQILCVPEKVKEPIFSVEDFQNVFKKTEF